MIFYPNVFKEVYIISERQQQACVFPTRPDLVKTELFLKYNSGGFFFILLEFRGRIIVDRKPDNFSNFSLTMVKSLGQVLPFEVHATAVTGRTPAPRSIRDI